MISLTMSLQDLNKKYSIHTYTPLIEYKNNKHGIRIEVT